MSKINQIQAAILSLDPGAYQKLMDSYIMRKYGFSNIMPLGSHSGTNKVTKGTPDAFVQCTDGRFILIAHGSVENHAYGKVQSDILNCLDTIKTGIAAEDISQIICCHTSTNFTPGQVKELCSYFENTILIGLGDVSFDLYLKYPDLAKDHLNIDIDTHQIFSLDNFITYASHNPYSTSLDMPLLCRGQELEDIDRALNDRNVILLSGPAGIGKTHLALESAKIFAKSNNYDLKIIHSNGKSIYQDLIVTFPDESNYMVVVDDADQLTELHYLLELSADSQRHHFIKIIITVRDYAREKLLKAIPLADKRCNEWIKYYIESNYNDRVSMSFLFGVVCNLPEEQRLSAVMIFCKCNPDFDAFRNIHIMPTHASWSGSEVPIIEQYIAFLIKFRENLKGIQFIEHRAYISEEIQDLQKRKEEVLLREFLEER